MYDDNSINGRSLVNEPNNIDIGNTDPVDADKPARIDGSIFEGSLNWSTDLWEHTGSDEPRTDENGNRIETDHYMYDHMDGSVNLDQTRVISPDGLEIRKELITTEDSQVTRSVVENKYDSDGNLVERSMAREDITDENGNRREDPLTHRPEPLRTAIETVSYMDNGTAVSEKSEIIHDTLTRDDRIEIDAEGNQHISETFHYLDRGENTTGESYLDKNGMTQISKEDFDKNHDFEKISDNDNVDEDHWIDNDGHEHNRTVESTENGDVVTHTEKWSDVEDGIQVDHEIIMHNEVISEDGFASYGDVENHEISHYPEAVMDVVERYNGEDPRGGYSIEISDITDSDNPRIVSVMKYDGDDNLLESTDITDTKDTPDGKVSYVEHRDTAGEFNTPYGSLTVTDYYILPGDSLTELREEFRDYTLSVDVSVDGDDTVTRYEYDYGDAHNDKDNFVSKNSNYDGIISRETVATFDRHFYDTSEYPDRKVSLHSWEEETDGVRIEHEVTTTREIDDNRHLDVVERTVEHYGDGSSIETVSKYKEDTVTNKQTMESVSISDVTDKDNPVAIQKQYFEKGEISQTENFDKDGKLESVTRHYSVTTYVNDTEKDNTDKEPADIQDAQDNVDRDEDDDDDGGIDSVSAD